MQINPIILPSWLNSKCVFQQGVEHKIEGIAAPSATVTLEIVKDPTDGRKVSKLDTDYGVILSREATTNSKGRFSFTIHNNSITNNWSYIKSLFILNHAIKSRSQGTFKINFFSIHIKPS